MARYSHSRIIIELEFVNVIWTIPKLVVVMCVMCVCVCVSISGCAIRKKSKPV